MLSPPFSSLLCIQNSLPFYLASKPIPYEEGLSFMEKRVEHEINHKNAECIWFLEHPSLYTTGTGSRLHNDVPPSLPYPVFLTGRGGRVTYHGPGQRIIYVILNVKKRLGDFNVKIFLHTLEEWIILTLRELGLNGFRHPINPGVWIMKKENPYKIAALGIRVKRGIAFHGIALNVNTDLKSYLPIVPCGLENFGVTSLKDQNLSLSLNDVDSLLLKTCPF